jgi:hypothetical protein
MKKKRTIVIIVLVAFLLGCIVTYLFDIVAFKDSNDYYNDLSADAYQHNDQIKNAIYIIDYDKSSGNYMISPYHYKKGGSGSYVNNSSVPLEQFIGKKVRITGHWVLTTKPLQYDKYVDNTWYAPLGAIDIKSIKLAD